MSVIYRVTRRDFLRDLGVGTGALVFGFSIAPAAAAAAEPGLIHQLIHGFPVKDVPFVRIKLNGDVVIITHRAEMGQGIRSSLAAVLVDELEADWKRVSLEQADADSTKYGIQFPFDVPPETVLPPQYAARPRPYIVPHDVAQYTDSSRSMAAYYAAMRLYGAAIRLVMIRAAAKKFGVDPSECYAEQHHVIHRPSGRKVDYRSLGLRAKKEPSPSYEDIVAALKKPGEWRFIGKELPVKDVPFVDAPEMVTGKTKYCADIHLPGMLTAMIERCPVANGEVASYDAKAALAVPGVVDVIVVRVPGPLGAGGVGAEFMPHAGIAVLAKNTWAALKGRRALRPTIVWDLGYDPAKTNATYDSEEYHRTLHAEVADPKKQPKVVRHKGDVDAALASARAFDACYYVPHLAQTPMEPPVAIALFENDRLELWAPTQNPDFTQLRAGAVAFGIPMEKWDTDGVKDELRKKVTLHIPLLGGGFGRKSQPDFVVEAAFLAAKKPGIAIRVQWTREDDIKFAYVNSASCQYLKAGLDANKRPVALLQRSAFPSIFATLFPPPRADFSKELNEMYRKKREAFYEGGEYPYGSAIEWSQGLEDMPFNVPNLRIENCAADNYIRIGWMRSVANVYHAFAICSFADELAHEAGPDVDHKDYLLELIGPGRTLDLRAEHVKNPSNNEFPAKQIDVPIKPGKVLAVVPGFPPDTRRLRSVIQRVAAESGWADKVRKYKNMKGHGVGIAAHRSFLTYVALVLDVEFDEETQALTIHEAHAAIDCGLAVNPDRVKAQVEGGINYGLSMALMGEITVKNGRIVQNNFDDYRVLRMDQIPKKVFVYLEPPSEEVLAEYPNKEAAPTGVGEPPTPVVAPALANAIFAATGRRIREMPFFDHDGRLKPGVRT